MFFFFFFFFFQEGSGACQHPDIQGIDARGEETEETLTIAILKIET